MADEIESFLVGRGHLCSCRSSSTVDANDPETNLDWEQAIREHGPRLHAIAYRITGSATDAEDVVQEVFLEAVRVHRDTTIRSMPGWLRQRTTYRAIDRRRSMQRGHVPLPCIEVSDSLATDEGHEQCELADSIRNLVASLPERQAAVFSLYFFERMDNAEIAETLSIERNAVAAALSKIRRKIEKRLQHVQSGDKP